MSWGYLANLAFELSSSAWKKAASVRLPERAWPTSAIAEYFAPRAWAGDTLGALLERPWQEGQAAGLGVTRTERDGRVKVRLFVVVDRSGDRIYEIGCLPRVLDVVAKAGGEGTLEVVSDGSAEEPGWSWSIADGAVRAQKLSEAKALARLEVLAKELEPAKAPAKATPSAERPRLEFRRRPARFEVAYRASLEPQVLDIGLDFARPVHNGMPEAQMRQVVTHLAMGVTGGAEFSPDRSTAKHLEGDLSAPERENGEAHYRWRVEVQGVSPRYLRHIVARMVLSGGAGIAIESMTIRGALDADDGALSVDTATMERWMTDPDAWLGPPTEAPFAVVDVASEQGMKLKLVPKSAPTAATVTALSKQLLEWTDAIAFMPLRPDRGFLAPPKVTKTSSSLTAQAKAFPVDPRPARDQLLAFLVRFHETQCPLKSVELTFPR